MALQKTGPISHNDVNVELKKAPTANISLNDADVRALAGVPTGEISLFNLYGKPAFVPGTTTFTSNSSFTLPAGYSSAVIEVWGGGGGGGTFGAATAATAGGKSSVSGTGVSLTSNGGGAGSDASSLGTVVSGGAGGTASGGSTNTSGGAGGSGTHEPFSGNGIGGAGGNTAAGVNAYTSGGVGGATVVAVGNTAGNAGGPPGAGGSGAVVYIATIVHQGQGGGGGGGGGYSRITALPATSPSGTVLTIVVGSGGDGALKGNAISNGGRGADGYVVITTT